jgi:hypothetical protein
MTAEYSETAPNLKVRTILKRITMKKILLFLGFSVITLSSFSQKRTTEVGKLENGQPVLTIDKATVLRVYNANLLKFSKIDAKFNDVNLKPIDGGNYVLVFTSSTYKSSLFVRNESGRMMAENSTSCTTSDNACKREPNGCIPKFANPGDLYAYCTDCASGGTCTKTTSSSSLLE